jgi:prophage regulatory protein
MSESLLSLPEVRERTKLSKSGIYAQMMAGTFPRPRKSGARSLWLESEVTGWIQALPKMGQSMGIRQRQTKKPLESAA